MAMDILHAADATEADWINKKSAEPTNSADVTERMRVA